MSRRAMALAATASGIVSVTAALALLTSVLLGQEQSGPMVFAAVVLGGAASLAMMTFLALYVYLDAKSRGMNGVFWALLVVVFAGFPGFVVYILIRPHLRTS